MIRAVVFDLDNTIYDYEQCHKKAMTELKIVCMKQFGISEIAFEENFEYAKKIVKGRLGDTGSSHNRMLYIQSFLELIEEKPAIYALELYNVYWDTMLDNMFPFSYVVPLFRELKKREIKIAVLTDLTAHIQHRKLKKLGIAQYIDVLVTSEEAGTEKPDLKMFKLVKEKLNMESEELLMIGDSKKKDIEGAEAAGIKGILFDENIRPKIRTICMEMIKRETSGE